GLIDALNAKNAGDLANVGQDRFELAAIDDFEAGIDAGVQFVRTAFEIADVRTGTANDGSDFREQASTILGTNHELYRECGRGLAAPFHSDAALGLVQKILHVGAELVVYGDASATRDVADDVITRNGIAALCTKDKQIVM